MNLTSFRLLKEPAETLFIWNMHIWWQLISYQEVIKFRCIDLFKTWMFLELYMNAAAGNIWIDPSFWLEMNECLMFCLFELQALYEEVLPAFDVLGKKSFFLGPVGNGAKMKLVVNMVMGR